MASHPPRDHYDQQFQSGEGEPLLARAEVALPVPFIHTPATCAGAVK